MRNGGHMLQIGALPFPFLGKAIDPLTLNQGFGVSRLIRAHPKPRESLSCCDEKGTGDVRASG